MITREFYLKQEMTLSYKLKKTMTQNGNASKDTSVYIFQMWKSFIQDSKLKVKNLLTV